MRQPTKQNIHETYFVVRTRSVSGLRAMIRKKAGTQRIGSILIIAPQSQHTSVYTAFSRYPILVIGSTTGKDRGYTASIRVMGVATHRHIETVVARGKPAKNFLSTAQSTFTRLETVLTKRGISPHTIVRYWNYMVNIQANYPYFNSARDHFFTRHHITRYPAATGIESNMDSSQIGIMTESIKSHAGLTIQHLTSGLQPPARSYGPKFARATLVHDKKHQYKKLYISGTAAILPDGTSLRSTSTKQHIKITLAAVRHLLRKASMDFNDIATSILYLKNPADRTVLQTVLHTQKLDFPYLLLYTNVCRPELLFEMECTALRSTQHA